MAVPSSTYQDIIDWALSQQNHEVTHGQSAPLNQNLRKALLDLHQIIKPAPELGDTDWVSLLYRYRQSNPGTSDIVFTEKPAVESTVQQPYWNVFVSLHEHPDEPFPLARENAVPSFIRKKDARRYAAKCAVEWLMAEKLMPDNGRDAAFPKPKMVPVSSGARAPKRQKLAAAGPATPPTSTAQPAAAANLLSLVKQEPGASGEPAVDEDEEQTVRQVVQLCKDLGMQPPMYRINCEHGEFWGGHAEFDRVTSSGVELALNVGQVSNIYGGKKLVKEAVAGQLLPVLRKIKAEREAIYDELVQSLGSSGSAV